MNRNDAPVKVSIIVPTYNRSDYLPAAVTSLVNQTVKPHEIIVINDGSNYDVHGLIAESLLAEGLLAEHGTLVQVIDKHNEGKPAAVNLGVERATGNYIWVFDDDDSAEPDYIEQCLPVLERGETDYVFGWHYAGLSLSADQIAKTELRRPRLEADEDIFPALLSGCSIAHNAIIAKKSCYLALGGIDTSYPCSEDYEFQLRLAKNYKGSFINTPSFTRRVHSGERGSGSFRYQASERRKRFLVHDRRFISTYLRELPLSAYRLGAFDRIEDKGLNVRAHYLYKFQVALCVGLWDAAIDTLKEAAADPACAQGPLQNTEIKQLSTLYAYAEEDIIAVFKAAEHIGALRKLRRTNTSRFVQDVDNTIMRAFVKRILLYIRRGQIRPVSTNIALLITVLRARYYGFQASNVPRHHH